MLTGHLPEFLIVMVLALVVFGPSRLPEVANALGRGIREFRRATSELEDAVMNQGEVDDFADEDMFPHIPPEPAEHLETSKEPAVDTLSTYRNQVQPTGPDASAEEEVGSPS